ncbi:zinc-dependent metalloprotease [Antribacter gilvus]|uniref:zinc-dependent metalloprotease n=1 Tax=Antribacter gilvus TaxID=2304675 RepID=UPI000F789F43|nr:zinc-dependent metalloprotease [Antribacter gilvus]
MTSPSAGNGVVDWPAAAQIAARLAPPGPQASRADLDALVAGLRTAAGDAVEHVLEVTSMVPVVADAGSGSPGASGTPALGRVVVVDRASWAKANTQVMAAMTEGLGDAVAAAVKAPVSAAGQLAGAAEVGAVLALLSGRVLGQFDPYSPARPGSAAGSSAAGSAPAGPGRLLLVAPNVLQAEQALGVPVHDFRLWVCLHEQTHALQFAAAPWLAGHLAGRTQTLVAGLTETSAELARARLDRKIAMAGRAVLHVLRGEGGSLAESFLTPGQKEQLADISAVMALLEGHADVMMDAVGSSVVPSVRRIRARFERRRDGEGRPGADVVLRRVLGMDAKLAQYRDGARFVRSVERRVGRDGLNAVWADAAHLPTAREIHDARAWVRRVHG